MTITKFVSAMTLATTAMSVPAGASVYTDDLGKCLVKATTEADKTLFVKWVFGALSAGPAVAAMSNVTKADRDAYTRAIGTLMDRLVLIDCRQAAIDAVKADGSSAIEASFQLLGGVAARQLMSDPAVTAQMQAIGDTIDKKGWAALMKAGGEPAPK